MAIKTFVALAASAMGLANAQMSGSSMSSMSTMSTMARMSSMSSMSSMSNSSASMAAPTMAAPAPSAGMPMPSNATCGAGLRVCYVSDPTRLEAPWAGSSGKYPQCYDPSMYSCTFNFLCPVGTVKLAGLYACSDFGASNGTTFPNSTNLGGPTTQLLETVVNAPSVGDVDGVMGADFIVDITFNALSMDANSAIPRTPLYQDMESSTFGPGPNAAFPGLVVLQNTTSEEIGGPSVNLAGTFQLNGLSQRNGLNQWNTVWQAGGPLFGIGPSELVIYYVNGTAGMTAPYRPTSGVISNVVRVPFTISNRSELSVPTDFPDCYNGDVYQEDTGSTDTRVDIAVPYPMPGDVVGVNGSAWMMDVAGTATSSIYNYQLSVENGYESGYNAPNSSTFAPGGNAFLPGMVVTLNTTMDMGPFSGPNTNLAGLFQVNVGRVVNCNSMMQVWSSWFVGNPIAGTGPVMATAYFVNGVAPDVVNDNTPMRAISPVATVEFTIA